MNPQAEIKLQQAKAMLRNAIIQASLNPIDPYSDLALEINAGFEALFEAAVLEAATIAEHRAVER